MNDLGASIGITRSSSDRRDTSCRSNARLERLAEAARTAPPMGRATVRAWADSCCWPAASSLGALGQLFAAATGHGDCRAGARFRARLCASRRSSRARPRSRSPCRARPPLSRPRTSMPARPAISPSATSTSAIASRREICWRSSRCRSSMTRFRRTRRPSISSKSALQQAEANLKLAQVTWDRDRPLVKQGLGDPAAGHGRRPDREGRRGRGRRRATERRGAGEPAQAAASEPRATPRSSRRSTASSPSATSMSAAWCRATPPAAPSCSRSCRRT